MLHINRHKWEGNTSGYVARLNQTIEYLTGFKTLLPETVIGTGTVSGCCGLDRDEWILPGEMVEITAADAAEARLKSESGF